MSNPSIPDLLSRAIKISICLSAAFDVYSEAQAHLVAVAPDEFAAETAHGRGDRRPRQAKSY